MRETRLHTMELDLANSTISRTVGVEPEMSARLLESNILPDMRHLAAQFA